jgi:hypothetical protein
LWQQLFLIITMQFLAIPPFNQLQKFPLNFLAAFICAVASYSYRKNNATTGKTLHWAEANCRRSFGSNWMKLPLPVPSLSTAHQSFLSRGHFPLLDGLRCLSIVAVVWHHAAGGTYQIGILTRGSEGVSLFFSGFLITTLLVRERSSAGNISVRRFYLRRTLRIFPLYYAALALYVVLVIFIEKQSAAGTEFWRHLAYFLTWPKKRRLGVLRTDPANDAVRAMLAITGTACARLSCATPAHGALHGTVFHSVQGFLAKMTKAERRSVTTGGASKTPPELFLDRRTTAYKRYASIAAALVADQGGGDLPEARRQLICRASFLASQLVQRETDGRCPRSIWMNTRAPLGI